MDKKREDETSNVGEGAMAYPFDYSRKSERKAANTSEKTSTHAMLEPEIGSRTILKQNTDCVL